MRCPGGRSILSQVWEKGGAGGEDLAYKVIKAAEAPNTYSPLYELDLSLKAKIEMICTEIYGADGVSYTGDAEKQLKKFTEMGYGQLPVCIAKTQYSLSDNADLKGRPGFTVTIREVKLSAGAGFIVALTGTIMTMPGLGKTPAAETIDIKANGEIVGLF
jgi:formate--tetrahydrofolate ligase